MGDETFTVAWLIWLFVFCLIWSRCVYSHQVSANLLVSLIEQIPFCSFGRNIIFVPQIESHCEYYFSASCGFMFQFILPLRSQSSNLFVFRHLLRWLNLPPGINKVNRISSYLILSRIHETPSGCYRPAANKLVVSWCLLEDPQYLFCIFLSANTDTCVKAWLLVQWRADAK